MIKSITVVNDIGESLFLELENPWETGLAIKKIDGLGPSKANVNTSDLATSDGSVFNSSRKEKKNIVIELIYLEDPVTGLIEDTRLRTYRYFPTKKPISLSIETDDRIAEIEGYVESNEPSIFEHRSGAQISIVCPSAYFRASDRTMKLNGTNQLFMFPFSNESLTEPVINLGEIVFSIGSDYEYEGDTDTGIVITLHATGPCENFAIYNSITRQIMRFDTSKIKAVTKDNIDNVVSGDTIVISTVSGNKYVKLYRNGKVYNIVATLPKDTIDWLTVRKGSNVFGYMADVGASNIQLSIQTQILYEGV